MVAETVTIFGGLDILIANAGVHICHDTVVNSDQAAWWQTLETNLFGTYLCCRAAIPHLKTSAGGKIITIGFYTTACYFLETFDVDIEEAGHKSGVNLPGMQG